MEKKKQFTGYLTDEECVQLRAAYVKDGIIKPTGEVYLEGQHPPLASWMIKELKDKLIARGILKPAPLKVFATLPSGKFPTPKRLN